MRKVICMYSDETIKIYSELTEKINRAYAMKLVVIFIL